jgi:hypothetical protein
MRFHYTILVIVLVLLGGCVSMREKKSAKYYFEHEKKIEGVLNNYNDLYKTQPFNLGFSERDYSKIGIDILTDSIRYAMTNQQYSDAIRETVVAFGYDTARLRRLYTDLYEIRSIWLGKDEIFHKGGTSQVTYLSFRSVAGGNPFLDRKYYTLVIFDPVVLDEELRSTLIKQGFSPIKGNVYFKIMGRFR